MVCSDSAVHRKNYTQELYTQENKEVFINIFIRFISPIYFTPPQYKNFLVPLELQIRETYLQTYCTVEHPQTL